MSTAALKAFLARMGRDAGLQDELRHVTESDGDSLRTTELVRFAAQHGYDFTVDEVRETDLELRDSELETVTGGATYPVLIEGEAQDDKHKGWTDLLSYDTVIGFKAP